MLANLSYEESMFENKRLYFSSLTRSPRDGGVV